MSAAEDLFRQALALPQDERRALVARLAASLEDVDPSTAALGAPPGAMSEDDPGFDDEVERRADAFARGVPGVPAADALAAARARLR